MCSHQVTCSTCSSFVSLCLSLFITDSLDNASHCTHLAFDERLHSTWILLCIRFLLTFLISIGSSRRTISASKQFYFSWAHSSFIAFQPRTHRQRHAHACTCMLGTHTYFINKVSYVMIYAFCCLCDAFACCASSLSAASVSVEPPCSRLPPLPSLCIGLKHLAVSVWIQFDWRYEFLLLIPIAINLLLCSSHPSWKLH